LVKGATVGIGVGSTITIGVEVLVLVGCGVRVGSSGAIGVASGAEDDCGSQAAKRNKTAKTQPHKTRRGKRHKVFKRGEKLARNIIHMIINHSRAID
jgi:hypothetical protein